MLRKKTVPSQNHREDIIWDLGGSQIQQDESWVYLLSVTVLVVILEGLGEYLVPG